MIHPYQMQYKNNDHKSVEYHQVQKSFSLREWSVISVKTFIVKLSTAKGD